MSSAIENIENYFFFSVATPYSKRSGHTEKKKLTDFCYQIKKYEYIQTIEYLLNTLTKTSF